MPPQPRAKPEFSPLGRYVLMVSDRKIEGPTYYHDSQTFVEACGLNQIDTSHMSRFGNTVWAKQRGYRPCPHCN